MTIVEVVVTSLMVGLIALTLIGLDAAGKTTADQRRRSQAFSVAQADQERIKGLSGDQISTLNQDRTVTLDGVAYSVHSTGQFLSQSAGSASCSSSGAAADSAKVTSTVNWTTNLRAPITVTSVISPRAGGSLLAKVLDQNAAVLPGVKVTAAGSDPTNSAIRRFGTTDADGCTIFSVLPVGDYTVTPALAGYVDKDGNAAPTTTVTTTAGNTTSAPFTLGQAGRVTAAFSTTIAGTTLPEPEGAVALLVQRRDGDPGRHHPHLGGDLDRVAAVAVPVHGLDAGELHQQLHRLGRELRGRQAARPRGPAQRHGRAGPERERDRVYGGGDARDGRLGHLRREPRQAGPHQAHGLVRADLVARDQSRRPPPSPVPSTGWLDLPGQPYGTYSICADYQFQNQG